jgi:protein O-mannosyl-transferase
MAKQRFQAKTSAPTRSAVAAPKNTPTPTTTNGWNNWAIFLPLVLTFFAFTSSLNNKFVNWDDEVNIVENDNTAALDWAHVKAIFTSDVIGNYNPLPILTLAIERHFVGLEGTWLYHWTNLLLHLFCVFFAFRIAKSLGLSVWAAAFCALLFGVHPLRVESVAWVTERKDVLYAAFYLPALYLYIKYVQEEGQNRTKYYIYILILFFFSLLSKVQAVALPLSMLAIDFYLNRLDLTNFKEIFNRIVEKTPFFLMSLAGGLVNVYTLARNKSIGDNDDITNFTHLDRLAIGGYSFIVYLMKLVYPYEMSPLYPYPSSLDYKFYILAPIAVAAVFYGVFKLYKSGNKAVVFGFFFFLFNVIFVLQIVGAGQGFLADRFTYIAYLGCFFVAAYFLDKIITGDGTYKTIAYTGFGIFTLLYMIMTFNQNKIWENGATLWDHVLKYYPDSDMAMNNKARYTRENLHDYKAALEGFNQSIRLKPTAEKHNSRGKTYFDMGTGVEFTEKALADYNTALSLPLNKLDNKGLSELYVNRAAAYGRLSEEKNDKQYLNLALPDVIKGAEIDPKNKNAFLNGYLINSNLGNRQAAIDNIDKYNALSPDEADMYYSRGLENRAMGKTEDALKDFNDAIFKGPADIKNAKNTNEKAAKSRNMAIFYMERANTYIQMKDLAAAKADLLMMQNYGQKIPNELMKYVQ